MSSARKRKLSSPMPDRSLFSAARVNANSMQRRSKGIAKSASKCSRLRGKLSTWPTNVKPQMPVERVSMEMAWVGAVAPPITSLRCPGVAVEAELGVERDEALADQQHLRQQSQEQRQRRSPNGSYRACSSGKLWGRPSQIMQGVVAPLISIQASRRVKIQTIEYHVNSVGVSLPRRLLSGTYHTVRASTRPI